MHRDFRERNYLFSGVGRNLLMDGTTPRDIKLLLEDLLQELIGADAVFPDDVKIETIDNWFPDRLEVEPEFLVSLLIDDPESPVEESVGASNRVCLSSSEEAMDYLEQLRDTPWDDLNIDGDGELIP